MQCKNHPAVAAAARCAGCAEAFCSNCLVELAGQRYCGACKVLAMQGQVAPAFQRAAVTCKTAKDALTYAIVGIFCFGIILEPIALIKASQAKREIAADPTLGGSGMATAAQVIAIIGLILWVLGIIARISQMGQM